MATWSVLCKSLLKNAVEGGKAAAPHIMTFSKMALPHIKSAGTAVAHTAKSGVKFAAAHPKMGVAGLAIALPVVGYKKGLINFASEKVFGKGNEGKGLIEPASTALLGSHKDAYGNEKPVSEKTVDTLLGDGTYSSLKTGVGNVGAEGADVYYRLKDTIGNVGAEAGSLYYNGKEYVGGLFNGNGMVNHGNGYYDPTTAQYPSMSAVQGEQGQAGMGGGLMNNINSALSNVTGGNISKMNLASLLLASYMMFGRFGWLSKIAGLALGGMTMKNVNQRSVLNQEQQMNRQMQAAAAPQVAATPAPEEDSSMTVHRGR